MFFTVCSETMSYVQGRFPKQNRKHVSYFMFWDLLRRVKLHRSKHWVISGSCVIFLFWWIIINIQLPYNLRLELWNNGISLWWTSKFNSPKAESQHKLTDRAVNTSIRSSHVTMLKDYKSCSEATWNPIHRGSSIPALFEWYSTSVLVT